jgi:hypothetical protein
MPIDPVHAALIKRCQGSPSFFIDNFGSIQHPKLGIIPFKLFSYQKKCLSEFQKNRFTIFKKTRQCLAEGTVVYTPSGPKNIEDLTIGDVIYSYKNKQVVKATISDHFDTGIRDCIKISTENKEIICTPDHKFLINGEWRRADSLNTHVDSLTVPELPFGAKSSKAAPTIGWLISDGCTKIYSRWCGKPYFANSNKRYIKQFKTDAREYFGTVSLITQNASSGFANSKPSYRVAIQHAPGKQFVELFNLNHSKKDRVLPSEVFEWDEQSVARLLNRMWAGDGWFSKSGNKANEIGYGTQSRALAWQIVELLSKFDIHVRPRKCSDGLYRIKTSRRDFIKIFNDRIGAFGKKLRCTINDKFVRRQPIGLIKKIESVGPHRVFDITVDDTHCMIANGFVTHNCGVSTISGGFALWYAMFFNNKNILIVSKRDEDAMDFLRRNVKILHDNLPEWMRELWPRVVDNEHEILFPNGSRIKSLTSSQDTLRSQAASLNIIDEAAFIPDMDQMWAAGLPSIQHGGTVIVISTVKGVGNWYWQAWEDAIAHINNFKPILIDWWDMDWKLEFKDELSGELRRIAPIDNMRACVTKEEIEKYGKYWSPWLEEQYRQLTQKGDSIRFRQEVLAEFVGTGDTVLSRQVLEHLNTIGDNNYQTLNAVDYVNPYTEDHDILDFQDRLWIWNQPQEGHVYCMGVDTATGDASDFSTIEVFDINESEQVAELQIRVLPKTFSKMVDYVGRWYNNAFAVVERTGIGVAICQELADHLGYACLYRKPKKNIYNKDSKYGDVGFSTSVATKPLLNKALTDNISVDGWLIKSSRLRKEFLIYVHLKGGRTGAEPGKGNNDDLVISTALAMIGANQAAIVDSTPLAPIRNQDIKPVLRDKALVQQRIQDIAAANGVLLPVTVIDNATQPLTIRQELNRFAQQLGSVPIDRTTVNPTVPQKHIIRLNKNKQ